MIVASRILRLVTPSVTHDVRVDLFQPEPDGSDWICRYAIGWPGKAQDGFAGGRDSMQALLSAMQKIGFELYVSEANTGGQLSWADWDGFGFPVPANARDLLEGDDARFL
ncbi:MAG: hypothetical protein EKK40_11660 [Bradyrhizobiaceae bacterium]|nr:MAG: hypothetical protein EKK40_11660 [Bradyrhizobiaceae bacterium]